MGIYTVGETSRLESPNKEYRKATIVAYCEQTRQYLILHTLILLANSFMSLLMQNREMRGL